MQYLFARFSQRIINSVFILSLREAFISILPFIIISAGFALVLGLTNYFSIISQESLLYQWIDFIAQALYQLAPLVIVIAISYYLSLNIGTNTLVCCVLAISSFAISAGYFKVSGGEISMDMEGSNAYAILIPVISAYLLKYLSKLEVMAKLESHFASAFLIKSINLIFPFLLAFTLIHLMLPVIASTAKLLNSLVIPDITQENVFASTLWWHAIIHIFWFLGIHGNNIARIAIGENINQLEILPDVSVANFNLAFVTPGGAGGVLSFIIVALLLTRDSHLRQISKFSFPFGIFNISETMFYGVPIVLNPFFLIPFLLCPFLDFFIAYMAIDMGWVSITSTSVHWMTPVLISGYIMGQGDLSPVFLQLFIISINAMVHIVFIRIYLQANSETFMLQQLSEKFYLREPIRNFIQAQPVARQIPRFRSHRKLNMIIDDITAGELLILYQPTLDRSGNFYGFETSLKFKSSNGRIKTPHFLPQLVKAGFSDTIDWWVIEKIAKDLKSWQLQNFVPNVSVNLNPLTLTNSVMTEKLIHTFDTNKRQVEIEIPETTYIKDFSLIEKNVDKLKESGISTAIDNFGTGYTSLSLLSKLSAKTIRLDKSILSNTSSEKGMEFYTGLCILCKNQGFTVVAEGVKTHKQAKLAIQAGVDYLQGQLYGKPTPMKKAMEFALNINKVKPIEAA